MSEPRRGRHRAQEPVDLGTVRLGPPGTAAVPLPAPPSPAAPQTGPRTGPRPAPRWTGLLPAGPLVGEGIGVRAGELTILQDVSATARPGRPLALTGPSGSGKSTLLAVLGALLAPTQGAVRLDDRTVTAGDTAIRREIGLVLQGYGLVNLLTVEENVAVALQVLGVAADEARDRTAEALARVELSDRADHLVEDLSGGQQQRVALARVFALQPPVLLADEPTAELDHDTRDLVLELMFDYARSGRILVVATHDPDVAARCDDLVRLVDGRVAG